MENNLTKMNMIYLDNNSTTHQDKLVTESMINHLNHMELYGNPSSLHLLGENSRKLIEQSRIYVQMSINAKYSNEIIFTSGGTESNNISIQGFIKRNLNKSHHIITSPFEHPSIENTLRYLSNRYQNLDISYVNVHSNGIIDLEHFRQLLNDKTTFVTIMHSNNEIGSIQPIEDIVQICRQYKSNKIVIHSDASQSIGKCPIDVQSMDIDLLTICPHKYHGPKGIGGLYIKQGIELDKITYGGQHEFGIRPGTENILSIIGFGRISQFISNKDFLLNRIEIMKQRRDQLYQGLSEQMKIFNPKSILIRNGSQENSLPNTLNITITNIDANQLIQQLKDSVAFSTGSACHSHQSSNEQHFSSTLKAIGISYENSRSTIRFSTSYANDEQQINDAIQKIINSIQQQINSSNNFQN